jgi:hypothetical protein
MFELDRAEFSASGDLVLDNATLPKVTLGSNPIETTAGSNLVKISHEGHGFSFGDYVTLSGVTGAIGGQASTVYGESIFLISLVTWEGYTIDIGTAPADMLTSAIGGGDEVTATQQVVYNEFVPQVQTITPNGTNITAKLRNPSTFASYGTLRSSQAVTYSLGTVPTPVFLNDYNSSTQQNVVASSDNASGAVTMKFNLSLSTSDSKVSPLIDLQRVAVLGLENVIDNSDAAQHITTPVVIDDASLGLKVIFAANRPSGASFEVYVKSAADEDALFATDDDGLFTVDWDLVAIDKALPTDDDPSTYRDYEYTHEMNQFTAFQVKIVMQSDNSSKSPVIRDLRAIALVTAN